MKSKITIEFQEEDFVSRTVLPVIQIKQSPSDDVRDKLVKQFTGVLKGESQWCSIYCTDVSENGEQTWTIVPISPENLELHLQNIQTLVERRQQEDRKQHIQ